MSGRKRSKEEAVQGKRSRTRPPEAERSTFKRMCEEFVESVRKISGVETVLAYPDELNYFLWTVVNKPDEATADKVYKAEYELLGRYPDVHVDFYLLERRDRSIRSIHPSGFRTVYKRAELTK